MHTILPEERESQDPQNVSILNEANTVETGETSASPANGSSSLQGAPMRAESLRIKLGNEDRKLTMGEKGCVLSSSDDDVEDLSAFVTERLQCLSEGSVAKLVGDESVNVGDFVHRKVGVGEDGGYKRQSVCPNVTIGGDIDVNDRRFSPGEENNQVLREELGSANIKVTAKKAAWPIYTKKRSSVLSEQDKPLYKAVIFDVACESGRVGGVELSRGNAANTSEGVLESFVMSGGFSTFEGIAQCEADERFVVARMDGGREGMVRFPPVEEMFAQEASPKERIKY